MRRLIGIALPALLAACAATGGDGMGGANGASADGGSSGFDGAFASDGAASGDGATAGDGSSKTPGPDASADANGADASPPPGPAPWAASPCAGADVTSNDILSHFAPAATTATFGTVWADARMRQCQDQTGCGAWQSASSADLYKINWTGSGFTFISPTTLAVPGSGNISCVVPGPSCTLAIGPMTSNVYPPEQGRALGITPRVGGAQVQVGSWSFDPRGNYIQYTSSVVTARCLWGTMSGRVYGASGTYVETQLVVWGAF